MHNRSVWVGPKAVMESNAASRLSEAFSFFAFSSCRQEENHARTGWRLRGDSSPERSSYPVPGGASAGTRTLDTRLKRAVLYQLSYGSRSPRKAGSLPCGAYPKGRRRRPAFAGWWRYGDSNPGLSACKADALPAELYPHLVGRQGFEPWISRL